MRTVAFIVLLALGCGAAPATTPPSSTEPRTVDVVGVVMRPLDSRLRISGELVAFQAVDLHARITGVVSEMRVDRGSEAHRGDTLVRISAPELVAERAEADARAVSERRSFERLQAAAKTAGAVAPNEVEAAELSSNAQRARADALAALTSYASVTAPFDGTITERRVHTGALVGPTTGPMLRIETTTRLRLVVGVPEHAIAVVPEGSGVDFCVSAYPERTFVGTVARTAHAVDPSTRTMAVELDVDNHDKALASGMYAEVVWPVRRAQPTVFVPPTAIVETPRRLFVVCVRDGAVVRVDVKRGVASGDLVEVFGALGAGDVVVKRGNDEMEDGTVVRVRT